MDISLLDAQVRICIEVLKRYADGTLETDLCDELDEVITKAYQVWEANIAEYDDPSDYETPLTQSW